MFNPWPVHRNSDSPFKWVNTTLGNIKTALAGTYHHVSPKHAQRYLARGYEGMWVTA